MNNLQRTLLALSLVAVTARAQTAATARDAAAQLAAALERHDLTAVSGALADASRTEWARLIEASDRLLEARSRLDRAIASTFRVPVRIDADPPLRQWLDTVRRVEIGSEAPGEASSVVFDVRLHTGGAEPTAMRWTAVQQAGGWKIELPGARVEAQAGAQRRRLEALTAAADEVAAAVTARRIRSAAEARAALRQAERRNSREAYR